MSKITLAASTAAVALFASTGLTYGQLVVGSSLSSGPALAYYVDLASVVATPLWANGANRGVYGVAPDMANRLLYTTTGTRLNKWTFGTEPTAPTLVGGMYRSNTAGGVVATGYDDFTWANGTLYGWTSTALTGVPHGIYVVPTTVDATGKVITTLQWADTSANYKFEGLCYNPIDGLMYGLNDYVTGGQVLGLYSIDALNNPAAIPQLIAAFPTNYQRMDGLTVDPVTGKFYLSQDDEANGQIIIAGYTPGVGYDAQFLGLPYSDTTHRGTGLTWAPTANVPEPTVALGAALTALTLTRRR